MINIRHFEIEEMIISTPQTNISIYEDHESYRHKHILIIFIPKTYGNEFIIHSDNVTQMKRYHKTKNAKQWLGELQRGFFY